MDLPDELIRYCRIEVFPALVEFDETIPLIEVLRKESLNIFVIAVLQVVSPGLESAYHVRDASLGLVKQLR